MSEARGIGFGCVAPIFVAGASKRKFVLKAIPKITNLCRLILSNKIKALI